MRFFIINICIVLFVFRKFEEIFKDFDEIKQAHLHNIF